MVKTENEAFVYAARYCSVAERCTQEIKTKLSQFELSDEAVDTIVEYLKQEGFIDETRYIKAFINDKFHFQKWGRLKIKQQLLFKKLDECNIDFCLSQIDTESYNNQLTTLLKTKSKLLKGSSEHDTKAKLYRFALSKGYESTVIFSRLKQLFDAPDEDDFTQPDDHIQ
jgi:regulatory protein